MVSQHSSLSKGVPRPESHLFGAAKSSEAFFYVPTENPQELVTSRTDSLGSSGEVLHPRNEVCRALPASGVALRGGSFRDTGQAQETIAQRPVEAKGHGLRLQGLRWFKWAPQEFYFMTIHNSNDDDYYIINIYEYATMGTICIIQHIKQ